MSDEPQFTHLIQCWHGCGTIEIRVFDGGARIEAEAHACPADDEGGA